MGGKKKEECITVKARAALDSLWRQVHAEGLVGRPWGVGPPTNPFKGTNILMARDKEVVSVLKRNGKLVIYEFEQTAATQLGMKVRKILQEAGLLN